MLLCCLVWCASPETLLWASLPRKYTYWQPPLTRATLYREPLNTTQPDPSAVSTCPRASCPLDVTPKVPTSCSTVPPRALVSDVAIWPVAVQLTQGFNDPEVSQGLSVHLPNISTQKKGVIIHCWWECETIQPLWKSVWRFLKKTRNRPIGINFLSSLL